MSSQQQRQQQLMLDARRHQIQIMAAKQQANARSSNNNNKGTPSRQQMQPQSRTMGSKYDDLPILEPADAVFISENPGSVGLVPAFFVPFESACQHGPLSIIQCIVSSNNLTPAFLHHGLTRALRSGNIEVAHYLLDRGSPIVRETPSNIFCVPLERQIALFELLTQYGWTPNTPGYYGSTLLPRTVKSPPLLRWFLDHGANPNLGVQKTTHDRFGGPDTSSCAALEAAAIHGEVESVCMLLDAGAKIQNGVPLHYAAGVCPPGTNPHAGRVVPSREFDTSRIPVMELLVARGADVNQKEESRHMVAQYAIVYAVMAGAVERVKWLLEHEADPYKIGSWGSAAEYAHTSGNEEISKVIGEFAKGND
jgi:ankyrin repeat protein